MQYKFLLLITITTLLTGSCKKGEDDPFLSLRTRDARIRGEWELTKKTYSDEDGLVEEYDGTTYTIKVDGVVMDSYPYEYKLTIEKGGTTKTHKRVDTQEYNSDDYWSWQNTNKKKTILILSNNPYIVKRLTNKELVLELNASTEYNNVIIDSYQTSLTFKKK